MLEIVTFTGVDARTDLGEVQALMDEYPFAEFAILIGSQTAGGENPIFPHVRVLNRIRNTLPRERIAVHLCGEYARDASKHPPASWVRVIAAGVGRVQVNIHPEGPFPELAVDTDALIQFANHTGVQSLILQHRGPWSEVPTDATMIEYLFDRSEGAGISDFNAWPCPPEDGRRYGFAGGIGPHNIWSAMRFIQAHSYARTWIDMERRVRDKNYWFDLRKVRAVCESVKIWRDMGHLEVASCLNR